MLTVLNAVVPAIAVPQERCYLWGSEFVGLQIISDALIALACYSIPITLFYFVRKRQNLSFSWVTLFFAIFFIVYGTTSVMEIWMLWHPVFWISGALKTTTALASLAIALLLPLVLKALTLPDPELLQTLLQTTNQDREREIAERQKMEAALRKSEEKYRLLFSNELDAVVLFDVETGRFLDVNAAFEELYGYNRTEALQLTVADISTEPAQSQAAIELANSTGKARIHLRWHRQKNGVVFPVELCLARFHWNNQVVMCMVARDITDQQRAESALRDSEERFRQIAETIRDVFWVAKIDFTQILYVSPAYETIWKRPRASLYEQHTSFIEAIHPNDKNQALSIVEAQRNTGFSHEYRIVQPDGSIRWIWERAFPVYDDNGKPYRLVGLSQDITDRKLSEEALRLADFSFDCSAVAAIWVGSDARILRVNRGTCQMLGYSCEELRSMYIYELDPNFPQEIWSEQWNILRQHQTRTIVSQLQAKDGKFVPIEATLNYLEFNGEEYNFAFIKDISERLQAEATLRQQVEREQVLVSLTEHIRQSLDLEEILTTAVAEVRQLLQNDRVVIYRFNPDWSGTIVAESVYSADLSILGQLIDDPCFSSGWHETYQQGYVSVIEDIATSNILPCYRQLLESLQVKANIVVPILHGTSLWGLLVAHHCVTPHSWQWWHIDSLRQLTAQLAIAIHQSQLYHQVHQLNDTLEQQVQERTHQLQQALDLEALLKRISDKVRDSLDEQQILQTVIQELVDGLQLEACDTGIYNAEQTTSTIVCEVVRGLSPAKGQTFAFQDATHPEIYPFLLQGMVCQFCDLASNPLRTNQLLLSVLACPLTDDQDIIGDLWLFKPPDKIFNDLEVRLVQQIANQCTIAIRQARLYQAAQIQVQELERLNCLKDDFLSTVSHELRTPMSNIKMATQMLEVVLSPLGVLNPESGIASHYFQILQHECHREIGLINDLLDLSRLEADTEPLMPVEINLDLWIPHILEAFEERIQSQQQHLCLEISPHLPNLTTDLNYLEQTLTELLNNACKYTPSGETIAISAIAQAEGIQLSVNNSGVEIPANELAHVFEKFYRVPSHDPWKYGGTGLGLALVKRRVQRLQGSIMVASEQGWTRFMLTLPWKISATL